MALQSSYQPTIINGNGALKSFDFSFPLVVPNSLKVFWKDLETGAITEKAFGIDYTVALTSSGGTVTFTTAPTINDEVNILRNTVDTQEKTFRTNSGFPAEQVEFSLDKLTALIQENAWALEWTIAELETQATITALEEEASIRENMDLYLQEQITANYNALQEKVSVSQLNAEIQARIAADNALQEEINRLNKGYILIGSYNFGTAVPSQSSLTAKANEFKAGRPITTGDTILNLFDNNEWYWNEDTGTWLVFGGTVSQVITTGTIFVNSASENVTEDGTMYAPYHTIQAAVNAAPFGTNISISAGDYSNEDVVIDNKQNINLSADNVIGQWRTIVKSIAITGSSNRIGIKNIQVEETYTHAASNGNVYIDNMAVKGLVTISGTGYHQYDYMQIMDDIDITGTAYVALRSSSGEDNSIFTISEVTATLYLRDVTNVTLHREYGNVIIDGSTNFITVNDFDVNFCIISENTAGSIIFINGTARQANGSLTGIDLRGTAVYSLGKFEFEPASSNLNGPRIQGGLHSIQLYDHATRAGYTLASGVQASLDAHLDAISTSLLTKLGMIQYANGINPRSVRTPGAFYINNAIGDTSYPLPSGVQAQNRCFGFCYKGTEQYYGTDVYYITAIFFNVEPGAGSMSAVNTSGYMTTACDDVLYLNDGWTEVAPQPFKDFYNVNMFTQLAGSTQGSIPLPTFGSANTVYFDLDGCSILSRFSSGYIRHNATDLPYFFNPGSTNFEGDLYYFYPQRYIDGWSIYRNSIKTSYQIIHDTFANTSANSFTSLSVVYSTVENRFCIANGSVWVDCFAAYIGKYRITMDSLTTGANFKAVALRPAKVGLSLWPIDPADYKRNVVEDLSTTSVTLDPALENTDYIYGELTVINISDYVKSRRETYISFISGATATLITWPAGLADNQKLTELPATLEANKLYNISIWNGQFAINS